LGAPDTSACAAETTIETRASRFDSSSPDTVSNARTANVHREFAANAGLSHVNADVVSTIVE
jgi:hypothetical protein